WKDDVECKETESRVSEMDDNITTAGTRVKTVSESYYCRTKVGTAGTKLLLSGKVKTAQRNMLSDKDVAKEADVAKEPQDAKETEVADEKPEQYSGEAKPSDDSLGLESVVSVLVRQVAKEQENAKEIEVSKEPKNAKETEEVDEPIADVILDELLQRTFNEPKLVKDDKGKGTLNDYKGNGKRIMKVIVISSSGDEVSSDDLISTSNDLISTSDDLIPIEEESMIIGKDPFSNTNSSSDDDVNSGVSTDSSCDKELSWLSNSKSSTSKSRVSNSSKFKASKLSKIMKQDKAQQAARDEKLVPTKDRVTIGKSNLGMDPTLNEKEETYQVILDIIKNTPCYNAFLITVDEFIVPLSNDPLMDFLDLGYKGPLKHIFEMFVDHMHQPWRTLGAIINRCLSRKASSNDRLRPSSIEFCRRQGSPYHTVDNDSVLDRLKLISKGDIYQAYGKPILESLITDDIQNSEAYKTFIDSDEEVGTSLEVLDESKGNSKARDDLEDEVSTDDDEDDASIDIEKTNDERTDTDDEDLVMGKAEKLVEQKTNEELKADEEQKEDDPVGDEQVVQESFYAVKVLVSPEPTQIPPTPPLPVIEVQATPAQATSVPNSEALTAVLQRASDLEKDVKKLKQVDYTPAILESLKSDILEAVNKYLGLTLRVTLQKVKQERVTQEKIPKYSTTPYYQATDDEHNPYLWMKVTWIYLLWILLLRGKDDMTIKIKTLLLDQTKGRKGEELEKIQSVYESEHEVQMDVEEQDLDNVANDVDEPQADAIPKIPKKDWFKESPKPETLNPD
nr:hypothetical protein [Tanacetum cinerariifolium]